MYIIYIIAVLLFLFFVFPVEMYTYVYVIGDSVDNSNNKTVKSRSKRENKIEILIKIFKIIPIYSKTIQLKDISIMSDNETFNSNYDIKAQNKTMDISFETIKSLLETLINEKNYAKKILGKLAKIMNNVKVKKMVTSIGFNTQDYVRNSYINAGLNTIMCMAINSNQKRFNLNKLYYQIYVSNYNYYLVSDSIISFKSVNNIPIIISIIRLINRIKDRSDKNVRTSNREFNGNSNELA